MKKIKPTLNDDALCEPINSASFIDSEPMAPIAANDSESFDFQNFSVNPYSKSKTAHNKMLMRRRKRSQHPLRDLRLKRGFTLEELAELTTLSPSYLSRLESGSRRLNADILQRIATILGCHPGDLLPIETSTYKFSQSPWANDSDDEGSSMSHPIYIKDLPFHVLEANDSNLQSFQLAQDNAVQWITRPPQLYGVRDSFAFRVTQACCGNRYNVNDYIFAHPSMPIVPGCHILIITQSNKAFVGQFIQWKASEKSEYADVLIVSVAKSKTYESQNEPLIFKKSEIKTSYRLVGTAEAA